MCVRKRAGPHRYRSTTGRLTWRIGQAGCCTRAQWLFEALTTLPLNLRQELMLQLEGFDSQEIADMLGISSDNVGVRLHRARERLKALSKEELRR